MRSRIAWAATGYIGVVALDPAVASLLLSCRPGTRHVAIADLWSRLESRERPRALLLGAAALGQDVLKRLRHHQLRGHVPPAAIYCPRPNVALLEHAWEGLRIDAKLVFRPEDIPTIARFLMEHPATGTYVTERLRSTFDASSPIVAAVFHLLSERTTLAWQNVSRLASEVAVCRTTLFDAFRDARVPTPERIQLVYRLDAAFQGMLRTGSTREAGRAGGYRDSRSLRAGLGRLGVGLRDLRRATERSWLFDLWLARERDRSRASELGPASDTKPR